MLPMSSALGLPDLAHENTENLVKCISITWLNISKPTEHIPHRIMCTCIFH